jgi:SNF2 family DNA or RNA helicase
MTAEQQGEHDELSQPIASLMRRAQHRPLTQPEFLRLMSLLNTQRIICNGLGQLRFQDVWPSLSKAAKPNEALLQSLFSPKLAELRTLLEQVAITQERKVVVFSQWRRMLKLADWAVRDLLSAAGARAVFFTGEEGQRRRTQNLVDFHDDPSVRVLFASDAGGVGLNLQRAASCCVNLELPWNPAVLEQRIGRIYRMGQSKPVEVYNFVSEQGIEARIFGLLGDKKALFTGLFDGQSSEVAFERSGSFLNRVKQLVEPVPVPLRAVSDLDEDEVPAGAVHDDVDAATDDEVAHAPPPAPVTVVAQPMVKVEATQIAHHFAQIRVEKAPDGAMTIQAPAESAKVLAALFQGMAAMLALG